MKTILKSGLVLLLVLLTIKFSYAQQGNVWAFGYHAGLDFNFKPPKTIKTAIKYPNISFSSPVFASSSISDCKGKLIFYGSNAEIYNRFNKLMPHGHLNSADGTGIVYIVPFPNDTSKYYYLHQMDGFGIGGIKGLFYSIIDMTLDSGRGDVDTSSFETKLNPSKNSFTIVKHYNNIDYWIVSPVNNDTFYIYPLTSSGIGKPKKQPKISFDINGGTIRGNHKGDRIITNARFQSNTYGAVQYTFDNTFGVVSKPQIFFDRTPTLNPYKDSIEMWSPEYSPNDSFLYFGAIEVNAYINKVEARLYQSETYNNLGSTMIKICTDTGWNKQGIGLQLGPDNKIYVTTQV